MTDANPTNANSGGYKRVMLKLGGEMFGGGGVGVGLTGHLISGSLGRSGAAAQTREPSLPASPPGGAEK